jgi:hypothetical protein
VSATLATVFPNVLRDPSQPTNTLLIASATPISSQALRSSAAWLPPDLRVLAEGSASRLTPALRGGSVYTDDRAPVEWLVNMSLLGYAKGTR